MEAFARWLDQLDAGRCDVQNSTDVVRAFLDQGDHPTKLHASLPPTPGRSSYNSSCWRSASGK
ncbi:MAG: hypothetical protein AAFP84_20465 [Actinomycetota bacterium]